MALYKLKDFDPDYRKTFQDGDVIGMSVYAERTDDKIGSITNVLVDESGHFRYFVIDLGFWIFGKKVLLPVGRSQIDHSADRVYAMGLSKERADDLPEYHDDMVTDYDYEERVRGAYRPNTAAAVSSTPLETAMPLESAVPLESNRAFDEDDVERSAPMPSTTANIATNTDISAIPPASANMAANRDVLDRDRSDVMPGAAADMVSDRDSYRYQNEPDLYEMNEQNHRTFKLYEERIIANKNRIKAGEVSLGKHVETETQKVAVPVESERIVVERTSPTDSAVVEPGEHAFQEGEVARIEVYEETPDIRKEAYVAEEINVRKEVDRDTVQAEETLRKERLDIDTQGHPRVGQ